MNIQLKKQQWMPKKYLIKSKISFHKIKNGLSEISPPVFCL